MSQIDDAEAEGEAINLRDELRDKAEAVHSESDRMVGEVFDHLGRSFQDEHPRNPDDDI